MSSPGVRAAAIGMSFKALLHIGLFRVTTAAGAFPIGVETLVQLFEPPLTRRIVLDHLNALQGFIGPRALKYANIDEVKKNISDNVPELPPQEPTRSLQTSSKQLRSSERWNSTSHWWVVQAS